MDELEHAKKKVVKIHNFSFFLNEYFPYRDLVRLKKSRKYQQFSDFKWLGCLIF